MPATVAACGVQQRAVTRRRHASGYDALCDLLRRCADKDRAAWNDFVVRFKNEIYQLAYRFLGDEQDAEDVAIEAFVRLWQRPWWTANPRVIKAWLETVAFNLSADLQRSNARWQEQRLSEVALRQPDCAEAVLAAEMVHWALSRLNTDQRRAVILCMIHGLGSHDAALIMGRPRGTIRRWLSEARIILARELRNAYRAGG